MSLLEFKHKSCSFLGIEILKLEKTESRNPVMGNIHRCFDVAQHDKNEKFKI